MRKIIVLAIVVCLSLPTMFGCEKPTIINSDGTGVYNWYIGDVSFQYERVGNHTGHMVVHNPNTVRVSGVVKQCEGSDCDVFYGNSFDLREDQRCAWDRYYPPDENIEITMDYNGKHSINLIKLPKMIPADNDDRIEFLDAYIDVEEGTGDTLITYTIKLN